jgi:uncharacterized protein
VTREFLVPVGTLLRNPGATREVSLTAPFDPDGTLAATWAGAAEVVPGADVEVRLVLTSYLGGIRATGVLVAPWRAMCRRCAGDATGVLEAHVDERFRPGATADDEDAYPLEDETVDLTALVRDAVVLELPLAPLCRDECAGLCPGCGEDRNLAPCACQPATDPRWATLDALRVPDQA